MSFDDLPFVDNNKILLGGAYDLSAIKDLLKV